MNIIHNLAYISGGFVLGAVEEHAKNTTLKLKKHLLLLYRETPAQQHAHGTS